MYTIITNTNLSIKLLTTNKAFICYDLNDHKTHIQSYILTNDLHRYKNRFESFKAIVVLKNNLTQ